MKSVRFFPVWNWLLLLGVICFFAGMTLPSYAEAASDTLNVRSAVLIDAHTGKVLYSQNPDRAIPPASLTKILSMMVALDQISAKKFSLNDTVRISRNAAGQGGSRMHIARNERITLNKLLMGMAVSSGNDASMAVAEHVGRGSHKTFVAMMNEKARNLGMRNSRFKNPNGLPAPGQVTTARDMARLAYYYLRLHPDALRYHRVQKLRHNGRLTTNKNPLLGICPGADGLKTGWIAASGYNIISTVRRGNTRLIAVVLGAENSQIRGIEIARLIEAGFDAKQKGITVSVALRSGAGMPAYANASGFMGAGQKVTAPAAERKKYSNSRSRSRSERYSASRGSDSRKKYSRSSRKSGSKKEISRASSRKEKQRITNASSRNKKKITNASSRSKKNDPPRRQIEASRSARRS